MARTRRLAAAFLLAGALALGGSAAAQDADTPLDKAIQEVEALLTALRSDPQSDPKLVAKLDDIAANLRKAKAAAAGAPAGGGGGGGGGGSLPTGDIPGGEGIFRITLTTFLEGTELKDEEKVLAEEVLREFVVDYNLAKTQSDEKSKPVIRDHSERRIARSFAPRDANKLKDNLDTVIKRGEGAGGRRGGR